MVKEQLSLADPGFPRSLIPNVGGGGGGGEANIFLFKTA